MSTMPLIDTDVLRAAIRDEYTAVACTPERGFHFHTGRAYARRIGYRDEWLDGVPAASVDAFAGTGNPFLLGALQPGERVVDVGCGAGMDSLIAGGMVGAEGQVVGVDMTDAMLERASDGARSTGLDQVRFEKGYGEELPVPDGWADVVISNGVVNLFPDKGAGFAEIRRVLKPGGRLQIADILVQKPVSEGAKRNIDLWKG